MQRGGFPTWLPSWTRYFADGRQGFPPYYWQFLCSVPPFSHWASYQISPRVLSRVAGLIGQLTYFADQVGKEMQI